RREFSYIFSEIQYPGLPQINLHEISADHSFNIGETLVEPIEIMHYKLPILGYRINDFTYITDAKTISEEAVEKIKGTKILVINALQIADHISHFNLEEAVTFAKKINAEVTYLTHISHNLGLHNEVEKVLPDNIRLAYDGLSLYL
ncbi:MBL fold metallo-hydrolase, partial [Pedobacter sp.]|uniref:MBL fold metallo-hydrolase n=1 Tax=Pedobacter sp. TaxID=1411316 RepID=UPI002BEC3E8F